MAQLRVHTIELLVAYGKPVATLEALSDDALTEVLETTVEADSAEEIQNRKIMCLHWAAERGYSVLLRSILGIGNNVEGLSEAQNGATAALIDFTLARLDLYLQLEALRVDDGGIRIDDDVARRLTQDS